MGMPYGPGGRDIKLKTYRTSGDNLSYLIFDDKEKTGMLVDPGLDPTEIMDTILLMGLDLRYVIDTHHHSDHTSGNRIVKDATGAEICAHELDSNRIGDVDVILEDGDGLKVGAIDIRVLHTPGHTPGGICLIVDDTYLITGDTLFIDDCGRCDLPGGSFEDMFGSLQRIKGLPDHLIVLPGHDYGKKRRDGLGDQKRTNRTLRADSLEEFSRID